jgi:hypothetical protein
MKKTLFFLALFSCCILIGCNTSGTRVEYTKACTPENDGKYIETSGFLNGETTVSCSNIGGGPLRCSYSFLETPTAAKNLINADIEQGTWANNAEELKSSYKTEDIKIRDNGGNIINLTDKVKITGKITAIPATERCFIKVSKIEKQ